MIITEMTPREYWADPLKNTRQHMHEKLFDTFNACFTRNYSFPYYTDKQLEQCDETTWIINKSLTDNPSTLCKVCKSRVNRHTTSRELDHITHRCKLLDYYLHIARYYMCRHSPFHPEIGDFYIPDHQLQDWGTLRREHLCALVYCHDIHLEQDDVITHILLHVCQLLTVVTKKLPIRTRDMAGVILSTMSVAFKLHSDGCPSLYFMEVLPADIQRSDKIMTPIKKAFRPLPSVIILALLGLIKIESTKSKDHSVLN